MLFCSFEFIFLFLPLALIGYHFSLHRFGNQKAKVVLLLASLVFYGYWKPGYLLIIASSILVNYILSRAVSGERSLFNLSKKQAYYLSLIFNLGLLCVFKYLDFLLSNLLLLAQVEEAPLLGILLPLGISFFTFQQIAYQADCYTGKGGSYDFIDYSLFVSFFPQLIAGPIVHHKEMMPQFDRITREYNWQNFAAGVNIFIIGLFKKIVIADTVSVWANSGFDSSASLEFFSAWTASLSYTFQIYFDFSGYCDMAIGSALLFGIHLPVNFLSPYKAISIQDFWRRWHITLSRWLRDYIYIPLGGSRVREPRVYLNILITFLLGGIWHGAGWTFIVWGGMHGAALMVNRMWSKGKVRLHYLLAWLVTFLFVNFSWVVFRAESVSSALDVYRAMFGLNGCATLGSGKISAYFTGVFYDLCSNFIPGIFEQENSLKVAYLAFFGLMAFLGPNSIRLTNPIANGERMGGSAVISRTCVLSVMFGASLLYMAVFTSSDFLYFNF